MNPIPKAYVLAIDLGASSGRGMVGCFDKGQITLEEVHRFDNTPITLNGTLHWDMELLFREIKQSIVKAASRYPIESVAVDTWGVDFGLLDEQGALLENPVHYRDGRTAGMLERAKQYISAEDHYRFSGNQFMEINTAFQLLSLKENRPELLTKAACMLMMPDLFHYLLCGKQCAEQTIASTSQLYDPVNRNWSLEIITGLGLPERIFPEVVAPGTLLGTLHPALAKELGVPELKVMTVAGHDTQSAMVAVPAKEEDFLFLSCGTWSLLGTELRAPLITDEAYGKGITNESAYDGKTAFLQNITGLWLVQESRREWKQEGRAYSYSQMADMAQEAEAINAYIDPDDPVFMAPGDIPARVREYCQRTGQQIPQGDGQVLRCIYQSLAFKYRLAAEGISACTGKSYDKLHMIGGGSSAALLCRMTADAGGMDVYAGPIEATALGSVATQLVTLGYLDNLEQVRKCIRASYSPIHYAPLASDKEEREQAYQTFQEVIRCC